MADDYWRRCACSARRRVFGSNAYEVERLITREREREREREKAESSQ